MDIKTHNPNIRPKSSSKALETSVVNRSWLVTYMATDDPLSDNKDVENNDEWRVFESLEEAEQFYNECVNAGAYSVSVCAVVKSTDYEPHELFREEVGEFGQQS